MPHPFLNNKESSYNTNLVLFEEAARLVLDVRAVVFHERVLVVRVGRGHLRDDVFDQREQGRVLDRAEAAHPEALVQDFLLGGRAVEQRRLEGLRALGQVVPDGVYAFELNFFHALHPRTRENMLCPRTRENLLCDAAVSVRPMRSTRSCAVSRGVRDVLYPAIAVGAFPT